jgi:High potential iron-sulfur protein
MRAIRASQQKLGWQAYDRSDPKQSASELTADGGLLMSNDHLIESRRRFLKAAAGGATAAVIIGGFPRFARAADLPPVTAADPTANALGYVEDATTSTNAKHKAGDVCSNCQFYSGGATGRGPCQLFPGKSVSAKGWCVSHTPKKA